MKDWFVIWKLELQEIFNFAVWFITIASTATTAAITAAITAAVTIRHIAFINIATTVFHNLWSGT